MTVARGGSSQKTAARAPGVRFSEVMTGTISGRQPSADLRLEGDTPLALQLSVQVADLRRFLADPEHTASLAGWVVCPALGGRLSIERGTCRFFPRRERAGSTLRYWLIFVDGVGTPFTLSGVKHLHTGAPGRVWVDTTTLFVRILGGHLNAVAVRGQEGVAAGVVRIHPFAFAHELTTFRAEGRSTRLRAAALLRYFAFFLNGLREAYVAHGS